METGERLHWRRLTAARWTTLHVLSLGAAGLLLLFVNRNQWFWIDEWEFILRRGDHQTVGLFTPHFEHWSTLPVLVYRVLFNTVGLDSYLPYVGVVIVVHLLLTHLLWRASIRAGARPAVATAVAAVFAVLGAGAENLLWAFQITLVGAVAFGWLAVLLHDHDGPFDRRDVGGWLASVAALMCSGPAIVLVGVAVLTVALRRRRWLDSVLTAAAPVLVFGLWWVLAGHEGDGLGGSISMWKVLDYAWFGLANAAETVVGVPETGGFLVVALAVWWIRHPDAAFGRASLAAAGAVGALGFFALVGSGRGGVLATALFTRYVYVAAALLVPAVALVLSQVAPPTRRGTAMVLGACALLGVHNLGLLRQAAGHEAWRERPVKTLVTTSAAMLADGARVAPDTARLGPEGWITADALAYVVAAGWRPDVEPTPRQRLDAQVLWQVGLDDPRGPLGTVQMTGNGVSVTALPTSAEDRCVLVHPLQGFPQVALEADASSWRVRVTASSTTSASVTLRERTTSSQQSRGLQFPAGETRDFVSYADGAEVVLTLSNQDVTICGVEEVAS